MKNIIKNLVIVFSTLLIVFFISEIILNIIFKVDSKEKPILLWDRLNSSKAHKKKINDHFEFHKEIGYIKSGILKQNFKSPHSFKILVLGDSISANGNYIRFLSDKISHEYPSLKHEIINAGTGGYDTNQERALFEILRKTIKANLVILQFCYNDFNSSPVILYNQKGFGVRYNNNVYIYRHNYFSKSYSFQFFTYRLVLFISRFSKSKESDSINLLGASKIEENFRRIKELSKKDQSSYMIVIFPYFMETESYKERIRMMEKITVQWPEPEEIIDLSKDYQLNNFLQYRLAPDDETHPNDHAAEIASGSVFKNIKKFLSKKK